MHEAGELPHQQLHKEILNKTSYIFINFWHTATHNNKKLPHKELVKQPELQLILLFHKYHQKDTLAEDACCLNSRPFKNIKCKRNKNFTLSIFSKCLMKNFYFQLLSPHGPITWTNQDHGEKLFYISIHLW